MTPRLFVLCLLVGCSSAPPAAPAPPEAPAARPDGAAKARVADPQRLADFLPARIDGRPPIARHPDRDAPTATWTLPDRTVTVTLSRITDLPAELTPLELLGVDAAAVMDGHELRGLRLQGNPAQVKRQLDPPNRATLDVIAVSTYHVVIEVEPSQSLDDPIAIASELDIGSMTLLALREHKARAAAAAPSPAPEAP